MTNRTTRRSDFLAKHLRQPTREEALEIAEQERADRREREVQRHERELKLAFMSQPGATASSWEKERAGLLAADRVERTRKAQESARGASPHVPLVLMPVSKKRKDTRGKPVKHTPPDPMTAGELLARQGYTTEVLTLGEQTQEETGRTLAPLTNLGGAGRSKIVAVCTASLSVTLPPDRRNRRNPWCPGSLETAT